MSRDGNDIDRRAILARRAAFVSAALAAMSCDSGAVAKDPVPSVAPQEARPVDTREPDVPVAVDPATLPPWSRQLERAPPLDVPPDVSEADRVALRNLAATLGPIYDEFAALWQASPGCALPDSACTEALSEYIAHVAKLEAWVHHLVPLCGFGSSGRTIAIQRTSAQQRFLSARLAELRDAARATQVDHGSAASDAFAVLERTTAIAVPCLSCVAREGLDLSDTEFRFAEGSSVLEAWQLEQLGALARRIVSSSIETIEVRGHADPGEGAGAQILALARASAVAAVLTSQGVQSSRLQVRAYGTQLRVQALGDDLARSENRRVDFDRL